MPSLSPAPLFVIGIWRSGTSLLCTLLNQHPEIAVLYEGEAALLRPAFWGGAKADWQERWNFWNGALERHKIQVAQLPQAVPDLQTAYAAVCQQYAQSRGASIWGDKSPSYNAQLCQLAQDFPGARFIIIWRDPAGILRSIANAARKGSHFFAKPGLPIRALLGCKVLKDEVDRLVAQGGAVHQIQYEEMVRDPEAAMRSACKFLGIAFDPRMMTLAGADRSAIYDGAHHGNVKGTEIRVAQKSRSPKAEVLSPALLSKIERYTKHWQSQTRGEWPAYPAAGSTSGASAGIGERLTDQLCFWLLSLVDGFTSAVYSYAPISLLRWYRTSRGRRVPEMPSVDIADSEDSLDPDAQPTPAAVEGANREPANVA